MIRKVIFCFILSSSFIVLSGCWDRVEVNDIAIVAGTAFDKEEDKYRVTVQFPLVSQLGGSQGGGGGTGGEKSWYLDSDTGETILEAYENEQKSLSRQLYLGHRQILLIGEALARSGLEPVMDIVARMPQNRLTTMILITDGPARDILNAEATVERIPAEMVRELTISYMTNQITVKHIIDFMKSDGIDLAIPVVRLDKTDPGSEGEPQTTIKSNGMAVFRKNKLVGFLKEDESKAILWVMKKAILPTIDVPAPKGKGGKISIQFSEQNVKIEPIIKKNEISMKISIKAKGSVLENESSFSLSSPNKLFLLEQKANQELKASIEKTIKELQEKYRSDALGFGDIIYRNNPKAWNNLKDAWSEKFPQVKAEVIPDLHIEHTGSIIQPMESEEEWGDD